MKISHIGCSHAFSESNAELGVSIKQHRPENGANYSLVWLSMRKETIKSIIENSSVEENDSIQNFILNLGSPGLGFFPRNSLPATVNIDDPSSQRFLSYTSMFFSRSDAFAINEKAIELFDAEGKGNFIKEDIVVTRQSIWDAGTEIDNKNPEYLSLTPEVIGKSTEEDGTAQPLKFFFSNMFQTQLDGASHHIPRSRTERSRGDAEPTE